jgi:hypothetical protein
MPEQESSIGRWNPPATASHLPDKAQFTFILQVAKIGFHLFLPPLEM